MAFPNTTTCPNLANQRLLLLLLLLRFGTSFGAERLRSSFDETSAILSKAPGPLCTERGVEMHFTCSVEIGQLSVNWKCTEGFWVCVQGDLLKLMINIATMVFLQKINTL